MPPLDRSDHSGFDTAPSSSTPDGPIKALPVHEAAARVLRLACHRTSAERRFLLVPDDREWLSFTSAYALGAAAICLRRVEAEYIPAALIREVMRAKAPLLI